MSLGPIGDRIGFVTDPVVARPLITPELVFASNAVGGDVPVVWLEQDWVLATAPVTATPARLERLLRALDEISELLDSANPGDTNKPAELLDDPRYCGPGQ